MQSHNIALHLKIASVKDVIEILVCHLMGGGGLSVSVS